MAKSRIKKAAPIFGFRNKCFKRKLGGSRSRVPEPDRRGRLLRRKREREISRVAIVELLVEAIRVPRNEVNRKEAICRRVGGREGRGGGGSTAAAEERGLLKESIPSLVAATRAGFSRLQPNSIRWRGKKEEKEGKRGDSRGLPWRE